MVYEYVSVKILYVVQESLSAFKLAVLHKVKRI